MVIVRGQTDHSKMFLSGLLGGGGNSEAPQEEDGHSSVERIVDRLDTATMLPDRREACRTLRALAKVNAAGGVGDDDMILNSVIHSTELPSRGWCSGNALTVARVESGSFRSGNN